MITISLCMIVKNEEKVLHRCLSSVKDIVDEIIIVDTGSNDKTKEIAKEFTDNIFDFEWVDDFSKARNFSFSKATKDYIFWIDADDVILDEDRKKIIDLKNTLDENIDIVTMKYNYHFDEFDNPTLTLTRERILKRSNNYIWEEPVHEYITLSGNILKTDIYVTHKKISKFSDRNLKIFQLNIQNNIPLSTRSTYYYAKELFDHERYIEAIFYFEEFLELKDAWVEEKIFACFKLGTCYKKINKSQKSLEALLKSFTYDTPRAEICIELGYHYKDSQEYSKAIFWFDLATKLKKPETLGFTLNSCWEYIPNIELCCCYYKIGDLEKSIYHNDIAGNFKPNSQSVIQNKEFFKSLEF